MKAIYSFCWDYHRMGTVNSLFVAEQAEVEKAIGREVYFGEILGKHSEIYGTLKAEDVSVKTDDQEFIAKFESIFGKRFSTGHNPLDYLSDEDGDEDEE
jgi:hypothetical protein